ncbi:MAG: hypothetical protein JWN40_4222, partial [Phycisphaerales bacterium]|nr:hypothetical protein [Phycisphaerales bacterium]
AKRGGKIGPMTAGVVEEDDANDMMIWKGEMA